MGCINGSELYLTNHIRVLWEQHSTWTGFAITSIVFELPNEEAVVNRLLQNPVDFAITLSLFYGDKIASSFAELLTEHLMLAADLIKAIMAGDNFKVQAIEKRWYENGEEIAELLGSINPCWSRSKWQSMFFEHLGFVKAMPVYMIDGDYEASVATYDALEKEALHMADMMSTGIIRQFPRKFCR